MLPQVQEPAALGHVIAHQQLSRPRYQRLPAMPGGHQPGTSIQRLVQVVLAAQDALVGQQAHPGCQRPRDLTPVGGCQLQLRK